MLTDLSGWFRRNSKNMKAWQIKKDLKEINQIKLMLERQLNEMGEAV